MTLVLVCTGLGALVLAAASLWARNDAALVELDEAIDRIGAGHSDSVRRPRATREGRRAP